MFDSQFSVQNFKRRTLSSAISVALLASFSSYSLAEKDVASLAHAKMETVVVTATLSPVPIFQSLNAVTVLERIDIERYQAADLFELLSRVPGVSFIRNGGKGSSTSLILRGNQSDHTLFLIDGVRIGSATSGDATLSTLSTSLIERIEIIRGPKSNLYGADAIGGVVNIFTRKSTEAKQLSIKASYGSNNTTETTIAAGLNSDKHHVTLVANAFNTDGIDHTELKTGVNGDEDAFRNNSVGINYQYTPSDTVDFGLSYNRNDSQNEYDSTTITRLIYADKSSTSLAALLNVKINDLWQTSLQLGESTDESQEFIDNIDQNPTFNSSEFNTKKQQATWVNKISLTDNLLTTIGLDYQQDSIDSTRVYSEDSRYNQAAFVQFESNIADVVDVNIGMRHDDNEQFGSAFTSSALFAVDVTESVRLIASYGEGFKAPTFNNLYFPFSSDPNLVPEESKNYEIGLNVDIANTYFSVAAFKNDIENLIQFDNSFNPIQIAEAQISGVEFSVDKNIGDLQLGFTGSVIDPENKENDQQLRRVPEKTMSLDVDYDFGDFSLGFSVRAESERFNDVANNNQLSGYSTYGIRAKYVINSEWSVLAKVDNVTDKEYTIAEGSSKVGAYQSLGREGLISIVYTPTF